MFKGSGREGFEMGKKNKSKQVNKNKTALVRIDAGLHQELKIKAATEKSTIKTLVESALAELLAFDK